MPITYAYPQQGGIWRLNTQSQAKGQNIWAQLKKPYLYTWGSGQYGNGVGQGGIASYSSPVQITSSVLWSNFAHTTNGGAVATKADGTLWAWGYNGNGELGLGNRTYYSSPMQVGALTNWLNVSGSYSVLAIKTDGTLWSWGKNNYGQLGLNNTTYYSSPMQVGALTNWSQVCCGPLYSLAIKTDGSLWSWGVNGGGNLGLGNRTYYSSPKQVGALTNWASVSASVHVLAVKTDGTLWAWGKNQYGQLGFGNLTYYSSPKQVGALTNWTSVSSYATVTAGIKKDATLWMWGRNLYNQISLANTGITYYSSPKQIGSLTSWQKIIVTGGSVLATLNQ